MSVSLLLPEAKEDLRETGRYLLEHGSSDTSIRFAQAVFARARLLSEFPGLGVQCYFRRPEVSDIRRFPVKGFSRWLVFYRPVPFGVEVVRILHSSRNWRALFDG